jgi:hypothetical protein
MREPHIEGVAIHDDPESCGGDGNVTVEALTGARTGAASSREISPIGVPTLSRFAEGNTVDAAIARRTPALRGQRPDARAETSCARTGRSPRRSRQMAPRDASGRSGTRSR